jgi:hypothetical protein
MTYRDDRDADRARIAALEAELAAAKAHISELEGRRDQALVLASKGALVANTPESAPRKSASERWFGAPFDLNLNKEVTGSYPVDQFEDIVERIREIARDPGRTELLKSSLTWQSTTGAKSTGPFLAVTVTVRDGVTKIAAGDKLGMAAGAIYGGVGGGVGGGAIMLPILASVAVPILAPVFAVGWIGGTYAGTRAIFKRVARRRARQLQQIFDAVCDEISRTIARQG